MIDRLLVDETGPIGVGMALGPGSVPQTSTGWVPRSTFSSAD